jgi:hypothetical protein
VEGYKPDAPASTGVVPQDSEEWVCEFVRDTQPGERKGAVIVRPLHKVRWELRETGEATLGVKQKKPYCVDDPSRMSGSPISYSEERAANKEYREKRERVDRFKRGFYNNDQADEFFTLFGEPKSYAAQQDRVIFTYPEGDVEIPALRLVKLAGQHELARAWKFTPLEPRAHLANESLAIQCQLEKIPTCIFSLPVANVPTDLPPSLRPEFNRLDAPLQETILSQLKENVHEPGWYAQQQFEKIFTDRITAGEVAERRTTILNLRSPGRAYWRSKTHIDNDAPSRIQWSEKDMAYVDYGEYNTRHYDDIQVQHKHLYVRGYAADGDRTDGSSSREFFWGGVEVADLGRSPATDDPVQAAALVLEKNEKKLTELLNNNRTLREWPQEEPRLSIPSLPAWIEEYQQTWDGLREQKLHEWRKEDTTELHKREVAYQEREQLAKEFVLLREDVYYLEHEVSKIDATLTLGWYKIKKYGEQGEEADRLREQITAVQKAIDQFRKFLQEHHIDPDAIIARGRQQALQPSNQPETFVASTKSERPRAVWESDPIGWLLEYSGKTRDDLKKLAIKVQAYKISPKKAIQALEEDVKPRSSKLKIRQGRADMWLKYLYSLTSQELAQELNNPTTTFLGPEHPAYAAPAPAAVSTGRLKDTTST